MSNDAGHITNDEHTYNFISFRSEPYSSWQQIIHYSSALLALCAGSPLLSPPPPPPPPPKKKKKKPVIRKVCPWYDVIMGKQSISNHNNTKQSVALFS